MASLFDGQQAVSVSREVCITQSFLDSATKMWLTAGGDAACRPLCTAKCANKTGYFWRNVAQARTCLPIWRIVRQNKFPVTVCRHFLPTFSGQEMSNTLLGWSMPLVFRRMYLCANTYLPNIQSRLSRRTCLEYRSFCSKSHCRHIFSGACESHMFSGACESSFAAADASYTNLTRVHQNNQSPFCMCIACYLSLKTCSNN